MRFSQNNTDDSDERVNKNKSFICIEKAESLNYLYPNGHRITHQLRWFKGSRDRGLQSDLAA